jgi:hypothetical protein
MRRSNPNMTRVNIFNQLLLDWRSAPRPGTSVFKLMHTSFQLEGFVDMRRGTAFFNELGEAQFRMWRIKPQ